MSKKEGSSRVTRETTGTVDTQQASACTAGIFFSLMNQKRVHALIVNPDQVGDHAHPIWGTVSDIHLLQPFTWHFLIFITGMGWIFLDSCTIADNAQPTAFSFGRIVLPTSGTFLFRVLKCQA
jgi:hypothetical protein